MRSMVSSALSLKSTVSDMMAGWLLPRLGWCLTRVGVTPRWVPRPGWCRPRVGIAPGLVSRPGGCQAWKGVTPRWVPRPGRYRARVSVTPVEYGAVSYTCTHETPLSKGSSYPSYFSIFCCPLVVRGW